MIDPNHPSREADSTRYRAARKSTLISIAVNLLLTLLQIVVGFFGRSQALMADGLHSFSDLLSDFLVLAANRHGNRSADEDHPYGHARIETATTLILGIMMGAMGLALLYAAGSRLQHPQQIQQVHVMTLWIALTTLLAKELLFRYMIAVAKRVRSQMLVANAWHSRSDAASSLVVSVGIAGNLAGYAFLDLLAAALVAFMIVRMGWQLGYEAFSELVDTGLSEGDLAEIRATIEATPGVIGLHELRTRKMGNQALVDAHILVDPRISVSEGHFIAESARSRILGHHDVLNVMVHVDPEDDFHRKPSVHLPGREQLLAVIRKRLEVDPERVVLHYLDGMVDAEIFVPAGFPEDETMEKKIPPLLEDYPHFRSIRMHKIGA
ncbi:MAG: cation diffusion facilitator family transporter [Burkholderiales bacterium]